jgi:hypothetical protein
MLRRTLFLPISRLELEADSPMIVRLRNNHRVRVPRYTFPAMTSKDPGPVANTGTFFSTFIDPVVRQTPAANETRGDDRIDEARKAAIEYESVIDEKDRATIEDKINQ